MEWHRGGVKGSAPKMFFFQIAQKRQRISKYLWSKTCSIFKDLSFDINKFELVPQLGA